MPTKRKFPQFASRKVFGHPLRVGLYARVSTHDQQTLPLQIRAMREYAAKRGWTIVAQIKEVGSGASQRELRATLLASARRREIDVVLAAIQSDRMVVLPAFDLVGWLLHIQIQSTCDAKRSTAGIALFSA